MKTRQRLRKGLILFTFFLFPAVFFYLSPFLAVKATAEGVVNGSLIMFLLLFLSALLLGRAYCGWVCPAAGCQEAIFPARDKRITHGNFIKWIIWVPWIAAIVITAVRRGGYESVDFTYRTTYGLSIGQAFHLVIYLGVLLLLIVVPAFVFGRRSFCHHICWMAPFMMIGRAIRNRFGWASLRLKASPEKCKQCHVCTKGCPMSLPVETMVADGSMENAECILCGECVDGCRLDVIEYAFFRRP